tara:strand:- start:5715 stop:6380 length:666 start_codon:yes stop_codon:yes gene_type:complete
MINFFKKKETKLPDFWIDYENTFTENVIENIEDVTFVVLDTETTGLDFYTDRMLCIGALKLHKNVIKINTTFEIFIKQEHYNQETAEIHGILKNGKTERITELEAIKLFLTYLENSIIIAHHAHFDITIFNKALHRNNLPKLKNKVLDTSTLYKKTLIKSNLLNRKEHYSLDELTEKFNISKKDRHTALGDAYITAIAFLKILKKLKEKKKLSVQQLLRLR